MPWLFEFLVVGLKVARALLAVLSFVIVADLKQAKVRLHAQAGASGWEPEPGPGAR